MNIGLLTTATQLNYGATLQAMALREILSELAPNDAVETVNYDITPQGEELYGDSFGKLFRIWEKRTLKRIAVRFLCPTRMRAHRRRRNRTIRFLHERVRIGSQVFHETEDLWRKNPYDLFVVGSDQVWRWQNRIHSFCLLSGISDPAVKRISYAASLGWSELPSRCRAEFVPALERFDAISVREPSAVAVLKGLLGEDRDVRAVVDPTVLYGRERWRRFLRDNPSPAGEGDYAFVYWLNRVGRLFPVLEGLRAKGVRRIKIVLPCYMKLLEGDILALKRAFARMERDFGAELCVDAGPVEFVHLLANARYVVANSFHALMFSLLFDKPARIFVGLDKGPDLMAPRMLSFAERHGLEGVVFSGLEGNCDFPVGAPPDYAAVWQSVERDRAASRAWLADSLAACGARVADV